MAFCGAPDHSHTFQSTPIVKYTKNEPLPEARWSVSTGLKKSQIPCGFSDLWVDLVSPAGRLGRVSQRPTAPTVGGTRIRHVVQMNRLGVCYRMVMNFFSETHNTQILCGFLKTYAGGAHLSHFTISTHLGIQSWDPKNCRLRTLRGTKLYTPEPTPSFLGVFTSG